MTIKYETAEHMIQFLTFALSRAYHVDVEKDEVQDMIGDLFDQYCDFMRIKDIEDPETLDQVMVFFCDEMD